MILITILLYGSLLFVFSVIGIFFLICFQVMKRKKYFRKRGILFYESGFYQLFQMFAGKKSAVDVELKSYSDLCETKQPVVGVFDFAGAAVYVTEPELMRSIYVKYFDHFMDRRAITKVESDMFSKMIASLEGDHWKGLRSKLSPIFTTAKIRKMFAIFDRSSLRMCEYLVKIVGTTGEEINICKFIAKYTIDVIANCAFGIDPKCFDRKPDDRSQFEEMAIRFQFNFTLKAISKFIFVAAFPKISNMFGIQPFDAEAQQYFTNVIREVIKRRRETGEKQEDFLQLMLDTQEGLLKDEENSKETLEVMTGSHAVGEMKNTFSSSEKLKIDDDTVIANCEQFLQAGFDTLQSALIFSAYFLAKEQDVQEKLFEEVDQIVANNGGKLTYDAISQKKYLDLFINETLRYYTPATRTERVCTKDFPVPGTDIVIEKDTIVVLPMLGLHHVEKYYENPAKFEPERFLPEQKSVRHPYSYVPFGHGPRNCIGMRFALTEVKTFIAHLVHRFKLEPSSKTEIPPKFGNNPILKPKDGMFLRIQPRLNIHAD